MRNHPRLWHEKKEVSWLAAAFNAVLRTSRGFARVPPNLVTLACSLLVPVMCAAFAESAIVLGAALYAAISIGDGFDGAMARHQERLHREGRLDLKRGRNAWFQRGETALGAKLDPFVDKLCYFGALVPLGWNALPRIALAGAMLFAVSLTFLRPLAKTRWGADLSSNIWGKIKVQFERATIACLVFLPLHAFMRTALYGAFFAAMLLAGMSLCGQLRSLRRHLQAPTKALPEARIVLHERKNRNL